MPVCPSKKRKKNSPPNFPVFLSSHHHHQNYVLSPSMSCLLSLVHQVTARVHDVLLLQVRTFNTQCIWISWGLLRCSFWVCRLDVDLKVGVELVLVTLRLLMFGSNLYNKVVEFSYVSCLWIIYFHREAFMLKCVMKNVWKPWYNLTMWLFRCREERKGPSGHSYVQLLLLSSRSYTLPFYLHTLSSGTVSRSVGKLIDTLSTVFQQYQWRWGSESRAENWKGEGKADG